MSGLAPNKRKGSDEVFADEQEERKEDKRSKHEPAAAAVASSASAAAAAASGSSASAAAPSAPASSSASVAPPTASSAVAASALSSASRVELEEVVCSACHEPFGWADDAARLPRTLPCGHPLCTQCCKQSLALTPGSVLCPHEHGQCNISIAGGVAAAAVSTTEGWLRLLPPSSALIASLRNQAHLMTRLGRQGARCSHSGCDASVSHFCPECGDLCTVHERIRHSLPIFQSHKAATIPIAQKAATFQSKIAGPAATIRAQIRDTVMKQQQEVDLAEAEVKQLRLQLEQKEQRMQAKMQKLAALKHTAGEMAKADDSAVFVLEANRLEAAGVSAHRSFIDSAILNYIEDQRVAALQSFLGDVRPLPKAKLLYRGSRDGFKPKDW